MTEPAPQTAAGADGPAAAEAPAGGGEGVAAPQAAADAKALASEDTAAGLPQPGAGSPDPTLDEEAADYVANLVTPSSDPIPAGSASHFVGADQEIQFGSADEAAPPGSTRQLAATTKPEAPPGVPPAEAEARIPKADAESTVGKAEPTDAQDDPAATAGDAAAAPAETRTTTGTEPPGESRTVMPATERREKTGNEPSDRESVAGKPDGGEPVSGPAPTDAGMDLATPTTEAPVRKSGAAAGPAKDRTATGAGPSGGGRTETPAAEPGNTPGYREPVAGKPDGDPVSGAAPTDAGKDAPPPPTTEPAKKPEAAAAPAAEARAETGTELPGEDRTATPATEPMKKADDDIGELLSRTVPAAAGKDEAPPPAEAPAKKPAAAAESAPEAVPETTGKGAAEADGAKTGTSSSPGDAPAPRETITIRDVLAGVVEFGENDVFYVHAVKPGDDQGLWGIIQEAVTGNFARGVRLTLGERTDTYRVAVPKDADELLDDRSSSPLGLMIHQKSQKTIVYNRKLGRLTQDPDVTLYPGNELIIVGFEPEELIRLYKHFASADGG